MRLYFYKILIWKLRRKKTTYAEEEISRANAVAAKRTCSPTLAAEQMVHALIALVLAACFLMFGLVVLEGILEAAVVP